MRVLVTGGTGFTGAALVERLCRDRHDVVALDTSEGIRLAELEALGADVRLGSVVDRPLVRECVQDVDAVMHLAAAFRELDVEEEHYDRVNVEGTEIVLEEAIREGVPRFVYCSTCGVHGHVEDPPADEDAPIAPADYYQRTKYEAEPLVERAHEAGDVRAAILRPAAIYGPGDPGRFLMLFRWAERGWFPMFGDGDTLYHPLYIDNLVDAFVACLDGRRLAGRPCLVADDRYLSIEELVRAVGRAIERDVRVVHLPITPLVAAGHVVERICRPLGVEPPIFPRRVDWYRQDRAFDIGRAREELGYEPRVPLAEGLRRTGEWYRSNGYLSS